MANLAHKFAIRIELQKLRGSCSVGGPGCLPTGEDENVSLGIDGDAGDLAQIQISWQLQKIGTELKGISGVRDS